MEKRANYVAPTTELTHMDVESMITGSDVNDERRIIGPHTGNRFDPVGTANGDGTTKNAHSTLGEGTRAKGGPWDDYPWDSWD